MMPAMVGSFVGRTGAAAGVGTAPMEALRATSADRTAVVGKGISVSADGEMTSALPPAPSTIRICCTSGASSSVMTLSTGREAAIAAPNSCTATMSGRWIKAAIV